jgi:type I restriction enzyme, S subunit
MTDWIACRLADTCASIDYGLTASATGSPTGPKFLRITDIVGVDLNWASVPFVNADIGSVDRYRLFDGDIVIARTGATTGESRFIKNPPEAVFASYLVRLKIRKEFDPRYVAYWLKSPQFRDFLHGVLGDKSAQPNASASTMVSAPMRAPVDRQYQTAIASVLGALDDKIELNRRMNETLEAMARAIFKDWFVDFGPTRAKIEGRAPYLAPEIWKLFPDGLDDEGKPETWQDGTLSNVATLNPESWSRSNYPEYVDYVDLANTKWGAIDATERHERASAPSRAQRILRSGDTIVGTVRPGNGSYALIGKGGLTGSTGFAVLRPARWNYREFVYLAATSSRNIERLSHLADGAAYPAVRPEVVAATRSVHADDSVFDAFHSITAPFIDRMHANEQESNDLAAIRDLLLPKLISGEIRVKEAEKVVEGAL